MQFILCCMPLNFKDMKIIYGKSPKECYEKTKGMNPTGKCNIEITKKGIVRWWIICNP